MRVLLVNIGRTLYATKYWVQILALPKVSLGDAQSHDKAIKISVILSRHGISDPNQCKHNAALTCEIP